MPLENAPRILFVVEHPAHQHRSQAMPLPRLPCPPGSPFYYLLLYRRAPHVRVHPKGEIAVEAALGRDTPHLSKADQPFIRVLPNALVVEAVERWHSETLLQLLDRVIFIQPIHGIA